MLFRTKFSIDKYLLSKQSDPEGLIKHMQISAAKDLGVKVCEVYPFKKTFNGWTPSGREMLIDSSDAFRDLYELELVVVKREALFEFMNKVRDLTAVKNDGAGKELQEHFVNLLNS